jgi:hypothetical protein
MELVPSGILQVVVMVIDIEGMNSMLNIREVYYKDCGIMVEGRRT